MTIDYSMSKVVSLVYDFYPIAKHCKTTLKRKEGVQ